MDDLLDTTRARWTAVVQPLVETVGLVSRGCRWLQCAADSPEQGERVVGDDNGNDECYRGVEPVPVPCGQDDHASCGDARCRGGIGDGIEEDSGDRKVPLV